MSSSKHFKFSNSVPLAPMLAVLLIWMVYWLEIKLGVNFNEFGIFPRKFRGLRGILFSPFIHGSVGHLYNNTLPLGILLASLFYFYRSVAVRVLLFGFFLSGILTWIIARPSYHIGASGIIYLLASFIFFKGIIIKHYRLVALSLTVVFIYGGLLWYIFPIKDGISWEGHLSGFVVGWLLAFLVKTEIPLEKKYSWEKEDYNEQEDEFLKHFDEKGNFVETPKEEEPVKVTYHYKKKDSDD